MLLPKIEKTIKDNKLFKKGDKLLIGVSGGPDSVCLLNLINRLKDRYRFKIYIAHANHGLRGIDNVRDQKFVKKLAQKLKLPIFVKKINVYVYQKKNKLSLEEAARDLRHKFFTKICQKEKICKIALAHSSSDQVETILMNLLRGAGIRGLSGMDYETDFNNLDKNIKFRIIRPLLDCSKKEILQYLKVNKIDFCIDKTNLNLKFTRNLMRHKIIPGLKKYYPFLGENILNQARIFKALKKEIVLQLNNFIVIKPDNSGAEIALCRWQRLDEFYKRELILYLINKISTLKDIYSAHIEEVVSLINNSSVGSFKILPNGLVVYKNYDKIIISQENMLFGKKKIKKSKLQIPGVTEIKENSTKLVTRIVKKKKNSLDNKILIDYGKTGFDIFVRSRKPGDRFYPFGMKGSKKIQDFLVDHKIPKFLRGQIPILVDKTNRIIWLSGLRMDRRFVAGPKTAKILEITYIKSR
jgi:tRNA(Ile)-lysidine synthase